MTKVRGGESDRARRGEAGAAAVRRRGADGVVAAINDRRAQAVAQRRMARFADVSPMSREQRDTAVRMDLSPSMAAQRARLQDTFGMPVQRQAVEEDEELQMKAEGAPLQRQALEDEELLQGKSAPVQRVSRQSMSVAASATEDHAGLPDNLRAGIESLAGMDLADVRVHSNSSRPAEMGAHAYTQGNDIHVGPGQEHHLPHEAWHVTQQRQGIVNPTAEINGMAINDESALEREADLMGARAARLGESEASKRAR